MKIIDALPAPIYCMIPSQALNDQRLGKGEITTLVRLSRYLYGKQRPLDGTTAEFAAVLSVDERSLQRHLPLLGQSGWLLFSRPHRGYWTVHEIVFPAGRRSENAEYPKLASKLSLPVVVHDHDDHDAYHDDQQQQSRSCIENSGEEATILTPEATILTPEATILTPADTQARNALIHIGVTSTDANRLLTGYTAEFIIDVVRAVRARGASVSNPAGFAIRAIEGEWKLPEIAQKWFREERPADYLGEYADFIQH